MARNKSDITPTKTNAKRSTFEFTQNPWVVHWGSSNLDIHPSLRRAKIPVTSIHQRFMLRMSLHIDSHISNTHPTSVDSQLGWFSAGCDTYVYIYTYMINMYINIPSVVIKHSNGHPHKWSCYFPLPCWMFDYQRVCKCICYLFFPVCFPLNTGFTGPWLTKVRHPSVRGKLIGSNLGGSGEKQQARLPGFWEWGTTQLIILFRIIGLYTIWIATWLCFKMQVLMDTHFVICIDWPNFGDYNLDFQNLVINEKFTVCDQISGVM